MLQHCNVDNVNVNFKGHGHSQWVSTKTIQILVGILRFVFEESGVSLEELYSFSDIFTFKMSAKGLTNKYYLKFE